MKTYWRSEGTAPCIGGEWSTYLLHAPFKLLVPSKKLFQLLYAYSHYTTHQSVWQFETDDFQTLTSCVRHLKDFLQYVRA